MKTTTAAMACLGILAFITFQPGKGVAAAVDEVVVFGDSLSDNGNLMFFDWGLVPDPRYYFEGRFSNGPVWVEYLVGPQRLNASLDNRAIGGAQTAGLTPPGLIYQVAAYLTDADLPLSAGTLIAVWIGANDYLNGDGDLQAAVSNIEAGLGDLVAAGAGQLLVLNLPDLGAIPDTIDTEAAPPATAFTLEFNAALAMMLDRLDAENPHVRVHRFDVFAFFRALQSDPETFGFTNVFDVSPNFAVADNFDNSGGYVFWDEMHPTTEAHAALATSIWAGLGDHAQNGKDDMDASASSSCFISAVRSWNEPGSHSRCPAPPET